jgi:hypothetical protein
MSYRLSDPVRIFVVCFDGLHTELVENYQFLYYYAIGYLYLILSYKSLHCHNNAGNFCRFVRETSEYSRRWKADVKEFWLRCSSLRPCDKERSTASNTQY